MEKRDYNAEFDTLQNEYFKTKNGQCIDKMYCLLLELADKYIKSYARKKQVYVCDPEIKAHDVAATIIDRKICRRKGAAIKKITTYIYFDCIHELVKNQTHERCCISFNEIGGKV